jgi:hypothetical protein
MTWREYEVKITEYFQYRHPTALITRNIKLPGRLSNIPREIDILVESQVFGHAIQIAIECKNWTSKLDVADIGTFIDKLNDVGISKGIIISKLGYSEGARERAKKELEVQLQVLDFEKLPEYYGFWGNPYRGNVGAIISAPNGWVVNANVPKQLLIDMLCFLHPFEFDPLEARQRRQYMYFQIWPVLNDHNLDKSFEEQDKIVKQNDPEAAIDYWMEKVERGQVKYRKIKYAKNNYTEFTGGVQADDFFAYCVYEVNNDFLPDDLARFRYIMGELHLIKIQGVDPTNSHESWKKLLGQK